MNILIYYTSRLTHEKFSKFFSENFNLPTTYRKLELK